MDTAGSEILFSRDPLVFIKPKLINFGSYSIRDFQADNSTTTNTKSNPSSVAPYTEEDELVNCLEIEDDFDIKTTKSGDFLIEFHASPYFYKNIIGQEGRTRKRLERDTRTTIEIPFKGKEGNVVIRGRSERDVLNAKSAVELVVWEAREKHRPTHFISIPMVSDMIKHNFDIFKSNLLTGPLIRGLHPTMFQNSNKLHLTIVTLVLIDDVEKSQAIAVLNQCKEEIVNPLFGNIEALGVELKGIEIMNDDPTNVDVLYGKVAVDPPKYNDYLQRMANDIVDYFAKKGLVKQQYDSVKLHVTLINSLSRKEENKPKREPFDSTLIMEKYKHFYFGVAEFKFVHLSVRFTTSDSSYYDALTTVPISCNLGLS